jgi:glycerol-3-phosphate dehydrogenase
LWVDDARLVVLNALDAKERGAEVRTHCPATSARRENGLWLVETPRGQFAGRALVNAGGPGADDVARLAGQPPRFAVRRVRGSHIVVPKLFDHPYAYIFQQPDTRICFAIPYEQDFTLIGTTDRDHVEGLSHVEASADEIDYLCQAASRYFARGVTPADVVWTYAGVRALVDEGSGRPEAATRGYRLPMSEPGEGAPLLGVYGGKITSYRHVAKEAVDKLAERLPALSGPAWTAGEALPGGDFPHDAQAELIAALHAEFPAVDATRIARAYGTRARSWLGADLGRDFGAGLSEAEIDYLQREEWAVTAEDVLWRRTKLGLHMTAAERDAVAEFMRG